MKKLSAWLQIFFILGLVGFSTYCLYTGRFEEAFAPFPILALYWVFVASRRTVRSSFDEDEPKDEDDR